MFVLDPFPKDKCAWNTCSRNRFDGKPIAAVTDFMPDKNCINSYTRVIFTCEVHAVAWYHSQDRFPAFDKEGNLKRTWSSSNYMYWDYEKNPYTRDYLPKRATILEVLNLVQDYERNEYGSWTSKIGESLAKIEYDTNYNFYVEYDAEKENKHYQLWLWAMSKFSHHL